MKKALIIGAGPAGLTAAYELLDRSGDYEVTVFEESDKFGGIARTVEYKGNRMDMGGHRFFTKVPEVNAWWDNMLPKQGAPAADDRALWTGKLRSPPAVPIPRRKTASCCAGTAFRASSLTRSSTIIRSRLKAGDLHEHGPWHDHRGRLQLP